MLNHLKTKAEIVEKLDEHLASDFNDQPFFALIVSPTHKIIVDHEDNDFLTFMFLPSHDEFEAPDLIALSQFLGEILSASSMLYESVDIVAEDITVGAMFDEEHVPFLHHPASIKIANEWQKYFDANLDNDKMPYYIQYRVSETFS